MQDPSPSLERKTASTELAERLRAEILRGTLEPGTRLRQRDVAERFDTSTTPVREAFALLQAEGLLRVDPHRGAIVSRPTIEEVRESFEIREALEVLAIERAIPKLTGDRISELEAILRRMRKTRDQDEWIGLNNRFHLLIYEAAEMPRLLSMIDSLRDAAAPYFNMALDTKPRSRKVDAEHQEILAACKRRDVERARRAVRAHLESTIEGLLRSLPETGIG